ncbi:hypothetical protein EST38_g10999 [Candolleomyces aberdarensis]|uniref:Uncharacterized protein n=1 Tax=Candolleomyces aberdarensis TaxID=2316362 RepID=A0A4Q2D8C5_9AGAR|nr:hypothetical protein EST38_g10999 [Candolleomyces aberdarensis]
MPSTRRNRTRPLLKAASAPYIASSPSSPLRPGSEESDDISIIDVNNHKVVSWQDLRRHDSNSSELDDPMDYKFQDQVLAADYYQVQFGTNGKLRKYFAPLNGEMKPDDRHIRELLLAGGWISSTDSYELGTRSE